MVGGEYDNDLSDATVGTRYEKSATAPVKYKSNINSSSNIARKGTARGKRKADFGKYQGPQKLSEEIPKGVPANQVKRKKAYFGWNPSKSGKHTIRDVVRETIIMQEVSGLGGVDTDFDMGGQETVARNYDRAFAIDGLDGVIYQKGDVYMLVKGNKAEVIKPSESQLPRIYPTTTFEDFFRQAKKM